MWWTISEPFEYVIFISSILKQRFFFGFANNPKCLLLTTAQMFSTDYPQFQSKNSLSLSLS